MLEGSGRLPDPVEVSRRLRLGWGVSPPPPALNGYATGGVLWETGGLPRPAAIGVVRPPLVVGAVLRIGAVLLRVRPVVIALLTGG